MFRSRLAAYLRLSLVVVIAMLALAAIPAAAAPRAQIGLPNPDAEWAGWGLAASFEGGAPRIKFAAYVGKNNPPVLLDKIVQDITADCDTLDAAGNPAVLSVDGAGYANFDGNVYIECSTPDWRAMINQLAPQLRPAKANACECPPRRSPFWAASEFILHPVAPGASRPNMLLDATELGLTFSLPTNGTVAQSRMTRSTGAAESGTWLYDSAGGNRVLAGQTGPLDLAVIDGFNGLPFLTGSGWRPFFANTVRLDRFGQWLEPANTGSFVTLPTAANYTLTTSSQTVFIGRENSSGALLQARLRHLRVDPGCYGN